MTSSEESLVVNGNVLVLLKCNFPLEPHTHGRTVDACFV